MENMLNKLRSTITIAASNAASNAVSIASQVSNYLPGNPVTREFEATAHTASAGVGLSWKVYSGYKKSSRQDVSIFVFEKRTLDRWDRQTRELFLENLRKSIAQLTRIRHPQILTVQHPLEESRDSLAFATEPVLGSLSNVLGNGTHNLPPQLPSSLKDIAPLQDIEIKYGFTQICEGLNFLHNSVKIIHCALTPENIVINAQGTWKLFGFDFCLQNTALPDAKPSWTFPEYRPSLPSCCLPPLDFLAPECIDSPSEVTPAADMFSFGCLVTAVYNSGKSYTGQKGDLEGYKRAWKELSRLSSVQLHTVPEGLRESVVKLLLLNPQSRLQAQQFSQIEFFSDIGVKTLSYLDQMFQWDNMQKSQFYKGLPQLIPQLPHRVSLLRIVPALVQESVNPSMVPFILPVVLQVADRATEQEFVDHVLPHLKPIMKISEPIQVMVQFMQKMNLLLSKTPAQDVRSDVLPLLYRALDTDTPALQEMCLSSLPSCAKHLDKQTMKAHLLPRIQKLCMSTTTLSVRVSCLVCVGRLLTHLDKWLVLDLVVPFIIKLPSKEAPVIMAAVGILQVSVQSATIGLTKEIMANSVLPFLLPLTIENCLSPQQHKTLMALVRNMIDKVEAEHRTKLEYLNSINNEQKSLQQMIPDASTLDSITSKNTASNGNTELDDMFAELGLGQYVSSVKGAQSKAATVTSSLAPERSINNGVVKSTSIESATSSTVLPPCLPAPQQIRSVPQSKPIPPPFTANINTPRPATVNTFNSSQISAASNASINSTLNQNSFSATNKTSSASSSAFDSLFQNSAKTPSLNQLVPKQSVPLTSPGVLGMTPDRPQQQTTVGGSAMMMSPTQYWPGVSQQPTFNVNTNTNQVNSCVPLQFTANNMGNGMTNNMGNGMANNFENGMANNFANNSMNSFGSIRSTNIMSPMQVSSPVSNSSFKPLSSSDIIDFLS